MFKELNEVIRVWKRIARIPNDESNEALIRRSLLNNVSYRLPGHSESDKLLGLRILFRTLKLIFKADQTIRNLNSESDTAVLEGLFQYEDLEQEYVEKQTGVPLGYFISKDHLPGASQGSMFKIFGSLRLCLFALPIIFRVPTSSNRTNQALLITQMAEIAGLLFLCRRHGIKTIYDFIPFEVDGNLISYILQENDIEVVKLPSPGPLKTHNHMLLGSKLVLTSQYQFEELKELPDIRIQDVVKWIPEYAFNYVDRYHKGQFEPPEKTIGFYSHGGWLRKDEGHADDGLNIPAAEESLLADLAVFLKVHPEYKLRIYPHPKEKTEEWITKTRQFYTDRFGQDVDIAGKEVRTSGSFEQVDIAMAAFSTILYERMFCGFKTLIGNYGFESFPMKSSSLRNICFHDSQQMDKLVVDASGMSKDKFFDTHGLIGYRYFEYPYFSDK